MTMSSFLINSNYIEPKFPPFEVEYAPHRGPGGGDGGPGGGGPGYQQPPAPAAQHLPPPPLPHAGGSREPPASYYPPRAAREPAYPAAALYPAPRAAEAAYPYAYRGGGGGSSPGRTPQPEQPPTPHAQGPAPGLHAGPVLPPPAPPHRAAAPAPPRRGEAAPATPGVPAAAGSAPACPLLLAGKSAAGPKGREPVVYPWMKKIHVSAVNPSYNGGEPKRSHRLHAAAGAGAGEGVPLQPLPHAAPPHRDRPRALPVRAPGQDLVPEPPHEVEEGPQTAQH